METLGHSSCQPSGSATPSMARMIVRLVAWTQMIALSAAWVPVPRFPNVAVATHRPSTATVASSARPRTAMDKRSQETIEADEKYATEWAQYESDVYDSVVRVYCTHADPDWTLPWQRDRQFASTASGFVLKLPDLGWRVITNAHAVEYGSIVQLRRRGGADKVEAVIEAVGNECDLALLRVRAEDEASFFEGLMGLELGDLPELQDEIDVLGYPVGGESMSVTSGVVSRVEMQEYSQAGFRLLALQTDAAINPGNSGGPVVDSANLKVVGVAFQSLNGQDVENIGYVVPVTVLQHFLEDVARHSQYTGWCALGIGFCTLESPQFRAYLGMHLNSDGGGGSGAATGVMIHDVLPTAAANGFLLPDDVLLSVDNVTIANDGTIPFRRGERVALSYYVSTLFAGDDVTCRVLRRGTEVTVKFPLSVSKRLVPYHWDNRLPPYGVVAGLVFTALSLPYLEVEGAFKQFVSDQCSYLVSCAASEPLRAEGDEVVVLACVLAHRANLGYEHLENLRLRKCNGVPVRSLKHLQTLLYGPNADSNSNNNLDNQSEEGSSSFERPAFHRFEFEPNGRVVVMDAAMADVATNEVCAENAVPQPWRLTEQLASEVAAMASKRTELAL